MKKEKLKKIGRIVALGCFALAMTLNLTGNLKGVLNLKSAWADETYAVDPEEETGTEETDELCTDTGEGQCMFFKLSKPVNCSTATPAYNKYYRSASGAGGGSAAWAPYTGDASLYGQGTSTEWYEGTMTVFVKKQYRDCILAMTFESCVDEPCAPTGYVKYIKP